jgi:acetylornithine deacetylase
LQELERDWAVRKQYKGLPPGSNTINPAVIEGGRHPAFIPDECRLWITVHFYPDECHEKIVKEVEEHLLQVAKGDVSLRDYPPQFQWGGRSMIVERGEIFPSLEVDPTHAGVLLLQDVHASILGKAAVLDISPSVTDGGWLGSFRIPTVIYGPGQLQHAHAVNEQISIEQLVQFSKVMLMMIMRWCHQKK